MTVPGFSGPDFGHYRQMRISPSHRLVPALLTALAVVLALVAPATSVAAPADIGVAAAAVEPAVVQITTKIDYQQAIGTGTAHRTCPLRRYAAVKPSAITLKRNESRSG